MFVRSIAQPQRTTPTPPLSQPVTKRDKRRNMIQQGYRDLEIKFKSNRENHFKAQLNSISRDINYINRVNPYENKALDDRADDILADISSVVGEPAYSGFRAGAGSVTGSIDGDIRVPLGKWASMFVGKVNNAMETRDVELVALSVSQSRVPHEHPRPFTLLLSHIV